MRSFIEHLAVALREQEAATAILVYTDESYVHERHACKKGWYSKSSPTQNNVQGHGGGGKRLIIIHAMSREGMLDTEGAIATDWLYEVVPTAEYIFEGAVIDGDYHKTIDGERWLNWLRHRLIPTFKQLYPNKKMYLVLDNARYHKHRDHTWISPNTMSKTECVSFLEQHNIKSITVERERASITFPSSTFDKRNSKSHPAPLLPELQSAVKGHLAIHPHLNKTAIQKEIELL